MRHIGTLSIYFSIFFFSPCLAQQHDNVWMLGFGDGKYWGSADVSAVMTMRFDDTNLPTISYDHRIDFDFFSTSASVADSLGRLLFYTNGNRANNYLHQLMDRGDSLCLIQDRTGVRAPQSALILPWPGRPQQYILINMYVDFYIDNTNNLGVGALALYEHHIEMNQNASKGKVIQKGKILSRDTLEYGRVSAVKHANGRDWWIVVGKKHSDKMFLWLLQPQGVFFKGTQTLSRSVVSGLGQSIFSPNGELYIRTDNYLINDSIMTLNLYDFDRCTGRFSNQRSFVLPFEGFGTGAGVSPDARYLYVSTGKFILQYDLQAPDLEASRAVVGEWDGFISVSAPSYFYLNQLGPDGRIYVGGTNGNRHMNYIDFPHRTGAACRLLQHGLIFPVQNRYTVPNFPHFRLGPLDGSPCDTLGLDNRPLADFRWQLEDSLAPLRVTFTDLSSYAPDTWYWEFGDGETSTERYPVHEYPKDGTYLACLNVSNANAAHNLCRYVRVGVSASEDPELQAAVQLLPNPFSERLLLSLGTERLQSPLLLLHDATGRPVRRAALQPGLNEIDTADLPPGLYFWAVEAGLPGGQRRERVKAGKAVRVP